MLYNFARKDRMTQEEESLLKETLKSSQEISTYLGIENIDFPTEIGTRDFIKISFEQGKLFLRQDLLKQTNFSHSDPVNEYSHNLKGLISMFFLFKKNEEYIHNVNTDLENHIEEFNSITAPFKDYKQQCFEKLASSEVLKRFDEYWTVLSFFRELSSYAQGDKYNILNILKSREEKHPVRLNQKGLSYENFGKFWLLREAMHNYN